MNDDPAPPPMRYLPIVELQRRTLHGFELVNPGPLARGLEVGVRVAAAWAEAAPEGPAVMVDATLADLTDETADLIDVLLDAYRIRAEALIVRIPTCAGHEPPAILDRLVDRGVVVAVRDPDLRGAEYGLLAGAPFDLIELPTAAIDLLDRDDDARRRVAECIAVARRHDWLTMARDLDRLDRVEALARLGCDLASGPAVGPLLDRPGADRVVARYFAAPKGSPARPRPPES